MKRRLLLHLLLLLLTPFAIFGQNLFQSIEKEQITFDERQLFEPKRFDGYQVNEKALRVEIEKKINTSGTITLPLPNGEYGEFSISFYPISSPVFYEKFPSIQTFKLKQVDGNIYGYGDITGHGFHAVLKKDGKGIYIDPTNRDRGVTSYAVYYKSDYERPKEYDVFECGVGNELDKPEDIGEEIRRARERGEAITRSKSSSESIPLRKYVMAPIATYEYSQFHGGTIDLVVGALTTMIIRVNEITRREFSVEYSFIDNIDSLIELDSENTELTNGNTGALINEATSFIVRRGISGSTYDVGHVFCTNAGGLAQVGAVCSNNGKARGVSCGFNPIGDSWYVGLVGHELGHQMGSRHSFNFCRGNNESLSVGFEPGSGSTIMSYAGICGVRNIKGTADPYYNIGSVESIVGHMHNGGGNSCAEKVPQDNNRPVITLPYGDPSGLTIPISTPFELEAQAEIEGSSNVLYTWEQRDAGNDNCMPGEPEPGQNCPLFRSFPPTTDSVRVFPRIENILFNQSSDYEVLPTFSRSMRFACTVRDWNPDGGVIAWDYLSFDVSDAAGPFTVDDIKGTFEVGEEVEIKWDPAGTNEAPVDCKTVDIYLSEDGGFTYPHLLQAGVPNTGSYTLGLPNVKTNSARIKVKASENVFFNISASNFSIVDADEPGYIARIDPAVQRACPPELTTFFIETQSFGGFSNPISVIDVIGLPPDASFSVEPDNVMPGEITEVRIDWGNTGSDNFDLDIIMTANDADTTSIAVRTELISNDFTDVRAIYPEPNVENMPQSLTFRWSKSENADNYRIELAKTPDFDSGNIIVSEGLGDIDSFKTQDLLPANTLIYWRVVPINVCGDGSPSSVRVFQTLQLDCQSFTSIDVPKVITASGNGLTQSRLQVFEGGTIANVNVNNLRGDHQFVGDIAAELQSPAGTRVTLFENRCFNSTDFNLSLNDAASTAVVCPLNRGRTYRPKDSLAVLAGEELSGEWEIQIRDRTPGTSGQLKGWGIEVCGSISVEKPQFSSDTVYVAKGESQFIRPQNMQAEKEGNNSGDLLYTIVEAPKRGVITHGQSIIVPGSEFIQYAIDSYHLVYQHDGEDEELDFFSFVLTDKDGGWLGIDTVYIKVDAVLSNDNPTKQELSVFPNPARDYINISLPNRPLEGEIQLLNMFGQEVFKTPLNGSPVYEVPTFNQPSGMYLIRVNSGTLKGTKKILVQ